MNEKEFKGLLGESLTERLINDNMKIYKQLIRDLEVEYDGKSTQIDNILITSKGIYVIENKNYSGIIILENNTCKQVLGDKQSDISNPLKQNDYHIEMLSKILEESLDIFKSYVVMGYDTIINNRSNRKNVINIQGLVETMLLDLYNSKDIYTHEDVDNIYLKLLILNKKH